MKLRFIGEQLWNSGSKQIEVLEKKWIKIQNRKKIDKSNSKSVHSSANRKGEVASDLKNLSQLIGALFWCDSSAKI